MSCPPEITSYVPVNATNSLVLKTEIISFIQICLHAAADPNDVMDLDVTDGEMNVNPAVPASELLGTASTDVPYTMSVELVPYTTCWPGRTLYLLAPSFEDKQKWVAALEAVANDIKRINKDEEMVCFLKGSYLTSIRCIYRHALCLT